MTKEQAETNRSKILIVDDTPTSIMILGEELKNEYQIFTANSGEAALKKVRSNPPDLILLDIIMPGMDGYEVCKALKENEETRNIPIIFITAKDAEEDEVKGLTLGAVDYISKPFRLAIVQARVKTHLDLKRKTDMLENISNRDGLTGLFNRRQFDSVIALEWKRAIRNKHPLSMVLLDIDYFKRYNDNYGHLAGDECLKLVAHNLSATLQRASDFVARYGGEEFIVVLPDTSSDKAWGTAEMIRQSIEDLQIEHNLSSTSQYVTISVGTGTTIPASHLDHLRLLKATDNALYEAKQAGRNQVKQRIL